MKDWLKNLKLNENNISVAVGVIVIVVVGLVLFRYIRNVNKPTGQVSDKAAATEVVSLDYTIQAGDSLWKIAQDKYGSGFKWTEIYTQNKTIIGNNPNLIYPSTKITLPKIESVVQNYTVIRGDNLWNISLRFCGTGFAYPALAQANAIANPRLITPGQVLQIRCK